MAILGKRKSVLDVLEHVNNQPEVVAAERKVAELEVRAQKERDKLAILSAGIPREDLIEKILAGETVAAALKDTSDLQKQFAMVQLFDGALGKLRADIQTAREQAAARVCGDAALVSEFKALLENVLKAGAAYRDTVFAYLTWRRRFGTLGYGASPMHVIFNPGAVDIEMGNLAKQLRAQGMDIPLQPVHNGAPM